MTREQVEIVYSNYAGRIQHISIMIEQCWEQVEDAIIEKNYEKFKRESERIETYEFKKSIIKDIIGDLEKLIAEDTDQSYESKAKKE